MKNLKIAACGVGVVLMAVLLGLSVVPRSIPLAAKQTNPSALSPERNSILEKAEEFAVAGRFEEAIAWLQQGLPSLNEPTDKARAHEMLGDLFFHLNRLEPTNAVSHYDSALRLVPNSGRLHFKQGKLMFGNLSLQSQAVAKLEQSLQLGYTNADTFYLLGSIFKLAGDQPTNTERQRLEAYVCAMEYYSRALKVDTNHTASLGNFGDIAYNLGRYAEAAYFYEQVLQRRPEHNVVMSVMIHLAHTRTRLGNFEQAATLLDQAQLARDKIPQVKDPATRASLRMEAVRLLAYKVENSVAANKPLDAIAPCNAILASVAELKKDFNSPQLEAWNRYALEILEKSGK